MAADAPPPLAIAQPDGCIEQLLSIISERNVQLEMLKSHLQQQTQLCKLHADRAARAEALNQFLHAPAPWPPNLSPADLAALNALPPPERDAAWLRRLFVRTPGHAGGGPPVGPYEVAGLYVDAFFWSRSAARPDEIVAAVARVFPGVVLVPTECGPRFRGLARVQGFPVVVRSAQMERSDAYGPTAGPPFFSHPTSSPITAPVPAPAFTAKRKHSSEPSLLQPESAPTSKRVRTAPAQAVKCEAPPDAVMHAGSPHPPPECIQVAARIPVVTQPGEERPPTQLPSFGSAAAQTASMRNSYAAAQAQPGSGDSVPPNGHTEPPGILLSGPLPRAHAPLTHRVSQPAHAFGEKVPQCADTGREFAALEQEVQELSRLGVGDSDSDGCGGGSVGVWGGD